MSNPEDELMLNGVFMKTGIDLSTIWMGEIIDLEWGWLTSSVTLDPINECEQLSCKSNIDGSKSKKTISSGLTTSNETEASQNTNESVPT